jgi:large subunit ribosomal protein L7Ae
MPKKVTKKSVVSAGAAKGAKESLFKKSPRNFRIGGDIQPKRDLTRFVRWPKYVRIQRQKRILMMRLKSPPAIAQFSHTLEKSQAATLFKILKKYSPENAKEKKDRLKAEAEKRKDGKTTHVGPKPNHLKFGLNHVTTLVEERKAKLVVIAHDVEPIEIMTFLPVLCRKKEVPFCFVRGKARLGQLCHLKTATCVALTEFNSEDLKELTQLSTNFLAQYNENIQLRRTWGGGVMGIKNQHMMAQREKLREIELAKKANM